MKPTARPANSTQHVRWQCRCGKAKAMYLDHYDKVRCNCGAMFWALQPNRGGPFKMFPWSPPQPHLRKSE